MKHLLLLAFVLTTLSACTGGVNTADVQCPGGSVSMTKVQWEACYGRQDHDPR